MRAPICGDNLVRIAFLDESGRSAGEPFIVVAGPIVHGDRTYRRLVARLEDIKAKFIPEPDRKGFVFHAKDIFHAAGPYFKPRKDDWPPNRRFPILKALAEIPRDFGLPITFGSFEKSGRVIGNVGDYARSPITDKLQLRFTQIFEHVMAFTWAEIGIEKQMHRFPRDEICMIVAEDTDLVKRTLKAGHAALRDPDEVDRWFGQFKFLGLPLTKIEDTPHFAEKAESAPLQIADTCSFLIMRRLMRRLETQECFETISPQLVWAPETDGVPVFGEPLGAEQIAGGSRY